MKNIRNIVIGITLIVASSFVSAGRYDNEYTYAPVIDVQPVYENVRIPQNRRVCEDRNRGIRARRHEQRRTSGGGAVLGGIIGGLLGNRFGDGRGRDAATAVGIIAGAAIGSNARTHNNRRYGPRRDNRRHCYTQRDYYEEQRIAGYDVAYEYIGRTYHTRLQNHPGDRVRIQVNVQVAEF